MWKGHVAEKKTSVSEAQNGKDSMVRNEAVGIVRWHIPCRFTDYPEDFV